MSAVQGIVRGHKGAIKVCSELGKGTTINVLLPISMIWHRQKRTGIRKKKSFLKAFFIVDQCFQAANEYLELSTPRFFYSSCIFLDRFRLQRLFSTLTRSLEKQQGSQTFGHSRFLESHSLHGEIYLYYFLTINRIDFLRFFSILNNNT